VVYPKHGVGQITEFKKINIGGIDVETYVISYDKDKATGYGSGKQTITPKTPCNN